MIIDPKPSSLPRKPFHIAAVVAVSALLFVGCGGEDVSEVEEDAGDIHNVPDSEVPEIEIAEIEPEPEAVSQGPEAPKPVAVMPGDPEDESAEDIQADYDSMLDAANDALEEFYDNNGRFPKSMAELLNEGALTMVPRVPPGKKLIFDRTQRKFAYADK